MDGQFLLFLVLFSDFFKISGAACSWPTDFQSSTWADSKHGELVFGTTTMTGFTFTINGQTINNWNCTVANTFDTDGRLILLSRSGFDYLNAQFYAYRCMTFTKVTAASYRYYQNNEAIDANKERVVLHPVSTVTDPGILCDDTNGATGSEYQLIIRKGSESTARVDCPYSFLGEYGYIHTNSTGTVTCDTESSSWDTCTDNTMMTFDYSQCSTKVAYSATDTVWCVDNVPLGGINYVMVYNGGESESTIDGASVYRYACLAISEDNTRASVTPQHCKAGQTATAVPSTNAGVRVGATLEMVIKKNCSSCPMLAAPARGFVTVSTVGAVTKATYECESNYTLTGVTGRICQANNTWTDTAPSCSCAPPPVPNNGARVLSVDGHQANYSCNVGFSLRGQQVRNCILETAEWEDVGPECVQCDTIETPAGGSPTYSTDGATTQVSFTCDKGYSLAGTVRLNCLTSGSWDDATPSCARCPSLTNPISGSVTTSTNGLVTEAYYSCATAYEMVGNAQLTCMSNGTWDEDPPKCVCLTPASPSHGTVAANGSVAVYKCEQGYTISGVKIRTCKSDGTGWTDTDPTCSQCVSVEQPVGGAVVLSTDGTTTKATYTCERGYTLSGSSVITCQSTGQWDSDLAFCALCETLASPTSGTFSLDSTGTTTSAVYSCFEGYDLNGATTRQCLSDGSWVGTDPTCKCQSPSSITNGELSADGSTANYTCHLGYSISGPTSRSCQTDGSGWTGVGPECVLCGTLPDLTGGTEVRTTDGINTRAAFTCQPGYTLYGVSAITCTGAGSWDPEQPTCVACPSLTSPDSGAVQVSTDGFTSTATYSCESGYYVSGATKLTCLTTGSWDNSPPTCKCIFPSTPDNGEVALSDTSGVSVATYKCQNGFTLSGPSVRQCQTGGLGWKGSDPACVLCGSLTAPASGQFSYFTTGIMTKAEFTCDIYTSMAGENILSCQADGTWDNPVPTCVNCSSLSSPASGSLSISTDGVTTTAFYRCLTGYSLSSINLLTCGADRNWDLPAPSCICDVPPSPTNGIVSVSNTGLLASYSCNAGFELLGTSARWCLSDGTGWNGSHPICVEIPPTTTTTEQPSGIVSVHMAVVIILGLVIVSLMIFFVLFAALYLKVKKSRIGVSSERLIEDEPVKPKLMPEVAMPPSDTAKVDLTKPPRLPPLGLPPLDPKQRKEKTHEEKTQKSPKRPKKSILSRIKKKPELEKSPNIFSASEVESKNMKQEEMQRRPAVEKSPTILSASGIVINENIKHKEADKELKETHSNESILEEEKGENVFPSAQTSSIWKKVSKSNPSNSQEQLTEPPKELSHMSLSMSSMEIPNFDEIQPVVAPVQPFTEKTTTDAKTSVENEITKTAKDDEQTYEAVTDTNVVEPSPVEKPLAVNRINMKRKRERTDFSLLSFKDDGPERPKTPLEKRERELGPDRIMTPHLLKQLPFNYIHPVITHDAPSSAKGGRPSTAMSSRTYASYT